MPSARTFQEMHNLKAKNALATTEILWNEIMVW